MTALVSRRAIAQGQHRGLRAASLRRGLLALIALSCAVLPSYNQSLLWIGLTPVLVLANIFRIEPLRVTWLQLGAGVMGLWCLITIWTSETTVYPLSSSIALAGPILLFLLLSGISLSKDDWLHVGRWFIAGAVFLAIAVIYQWLSGSGANRFSVAWLEGNHLSYILSTAVLFSLAIILIGEGLRGWRALGLLAAQGILILGIIMTGTRASFIAVSAALAVFTVYVSTTRRGAILFPIAFAVACLVLLALPFLDVGVLGRLRVEGWESFEAFSSGRVTQYARALDLFGAVPLGGYGPEFFIRLTGIQLHNAFLAVGVSYGLVGLAAFVVITGRSVLIPYLSSSGPLRVISLIFLLGWLPILTTGVWAFAPQLWFGLALLTHLGGFGPPGHKGVIRSANTAGYR